MRSFIVVLFIFFQLSLFSQNKRIDSLQIVLDKTTGKGRVLILNELAIEFWSVSPSKSIQIANDALAIEKKYNFFVPKARTYNIIGVANLYLNNLEKADNFFSKCILTAEKYGSENDIQKALINKLHLVDIGYKKDTSALEKLIKKQLSKNIENDVVSFVDLFQMYVATYSMNSGSNTKKILLYTDDLLKKTTDKDYQAAIILAQGFIFKIKKDHFSAINNFKKALDFASNNYIKYCALINVGNIYFETHKYKESIYFFEEALEMIKKEKSINLKDGKHYYVCACLGSSYLELKKYDLALRNLRFASNNPSLLNIDVIGINNNIGYALMRLDSLKSAEIYINKAYDSCLDENNDIKVAVLNTLALF